MLISAFQINRASEHEQGFIKTPYESTVQGSGILYLHYLHIAHQKLNRITPLHTYLLSCHIRQNSRPFSWRYSYFLAFREMKDPILHAFHD